MARLETLDRDHRGRGIRSQPLPAAAGAAPGDRRLAADAGTDELGAREPSARAMQARAVSRAVNSVKNDTEDCIEPVGEPRFRLERRKRWDRFILRNECPPWLRNGN